MNINIFSKRVLALLLFLHYNLYSAPLYKILDRVVSSTYNHSTEHFKIYWGEGYPLNDYWLNTNNSVPTYIDTISYYLEKNYQKFVEQNLSMPQHIEVYILNSDINVSDPYLNTESVDSYGSFTKDIYPEILIDSKIVTKKINGSWYSYKNIIDEITAHELTHAYQFGNGLISSENEVPKENKWFSEGMSSASQLIFCEDSKFYQSLFLDYLLKNINSGFFKDDSLMHYTNGILFTYLVKKYEYSYNDFIKIFKTNNTPQNFIQQISLEQNIEADVLFQNIYNSMVYESSVFATNLNINFSTLQNTQQTKEFGGVLFDTFDLNIKYGWQLISLPFELNTFNIFLDESDFLIWTYKNSIWHCNSSLNEINDKCKNLYSNLNKLNVGDGYWLNSYGQYSEKLYYFK